jgi:predicted MFS family arabinose efflux permease
MSDIQQPKEKLFTKYQVFIIAILSILQFSIILDFMVLSPLGAIMMPKLHINTTQFGLVVSAYAFSAGASGLLAAGFADRFDRKKLLLFFYTGFIVGTAFCALAPNYHLLLLARIVTGIFGGVIGSISFAIIGDMFKMEVRGRVMGFVQTAFAASQVLGIPVGLVLANNFGWHAPFYMIAGFSAFVAVAIVIYMKPVAGHLKVVSKRNPFQHLIKTVSNNNYLKGFLATTVMATGGFMLMPFGSAFGTNNLGVDVKQLPVLYMITGIFSIITGPLMGKLSDKIGKYKLFVFGSIWSMIMVIIYTHLGITPLWLIIAVNVVMFVGISSRMISASALMTAVPDPADRGAFMSINSSVQQIAGGVASFIAGLIIVQKTETSPLKNYDVLGYVVTGSMIVGCILLYVVNKYVQQKAEATKITKSETDFLLAEEAILEGGAEGL